MLLTLGECFLADRLAGRRIEHDVETIFLHVHCHIANEVFFVHEGIHDTFETTLQRYLLLRFEITQEGVKAAYKFIDWWFTGSGLEAQEVTQNVDYSGMTPNAEWSISMCYLNAYLPTVNSPEYQAEKVLVDLTPSETAQVQMFTAPGTLFFSDAASVQADMVENWVFNGPVNPTYDDVQDFLQNYQADLEDYIAEYYN